MRIGIDARFYSSAFTGIGRYVCELIEHILKIDEKNQYVLFFNKPQYDTFTPPRRGVEKVCVDAPHYSFKEQWHFNKELKKKNLDLMHFTHFNAPILYRRPCIVTIHDLTLSLYPGRKMASLIHRLAYTITIGSVVGRARRIIAVSEHTKKDLIRLLKVSAQKVVVIHEGVSGNFHPISDTHLIERFKNQYSLTQPYLLYTGVWRDHKNLLNLIKAFGVMRKRVSFPLWLVITGKEDPWYPEVRKTVRDERLEGEVRFTGVVPDEDLVLLYNGALGFALPSFYEGFGLSVLEAFACGVPVAASRSSSIPEICGKDNALLFDPHNVENMADTLYRLVTDEKLRATLRERGLARAKEFSWQRMAEETLAVYNEAYVHSAS